MKEHRQGWRVYIRAICGWINSRRYRRNTQKFLKRFFYHRLLRYTQILFLRISAISAWCIFYGLYGLKDFSPILLSSIKLFFSAYIRDLATLSWSFRRRRLKKMTCWTVTMAIRVIVFIWFSTKRCYLMGGNFSDSTQKSYLCSRIGAMGCIASTIDNWNF